MELTYDWRSFQSVFYPQKRALLPPPGFERADKALKSNPAFVVIERNAVVAAFAEGENFSDYIGISSEALRSALGGREIVALEREQVDQWVSGAVSLPHLHSQVEHLRKAVSPKAASISALPDRHFLLDAILGRWSKALPSAFGVFIRLEKARPGHEINPVLFETLGARCKEYLDREQDILVLLRGGQLEAFYQPDLSPMGAERRALCAEVVKYLTEKHSVAIQGLTVPYVDWIAWNHARQPWRQFAGALKSRSAKLYPLRWQVTGLLGLRAAFDF